MKSYLKSLLPRGRHPRRILSGPCHGLRLDLDLACDAQLWLGLYERETFPALRRLAPPAAAFIDIGAGSGELSVWFARQFPGRPVLAFEPDPTPRASMLRNFLLNFPQLPPTVQIQDRFVDATPGAISLDEAAAALPSPVLVKIDAEGAESRILHSGLSLLQHHTALLLIETHSLDLEKSCLEFLLSLGYHAHIIPQAPWRRWLPEHRPLPHNQWIAASPPPLP